MAETAATLTIVIDAQNKASAQLKEVGGQAENAGLSLGKLSAAVGLGNLAANAAQAAIVKMGQAWSAVKDEYVQNQQAQAQLNAVLKSTNDISGMTAGAVNKLAEQIARTTPISKNATLNAENMLLTFTNLHKDVFPATTKAVADMATAMNGGATPSAEQLRSTAILVGKAMNDPAVGLTRLMRVGVTFTEQQKEQIKTMEKAGNTAGAQGVILQELSKEFGGSATAAAKTYQGQLEMLKNRLLELGAGGLQKAIDKLNEWAKWLMAHKPVLEAVAGAVSGLALIVGGALTVALVKAAIGFIELNAAALPWIAAGMAIGAIAFLIIANWGVVKNWLKRFWDDVKQWFNDGAKYITGVWNTIKNTAKTALDAVIDAFNAVVDTAKAVFDAIAGFIEKHKKGLTDIAIVLGTIVAPALTAIAARAAVTAAGMIVSAAQTATAYVISAAQASAAWVVAAAQTAFAWVTQTLPALIAGGARASAEGSVSAVKMGLAFIVQAARTAVAWAITFAEFTAGLAVMVADFLMQAARMAAGWLLALGPIGLVVAVAIGAVLLIINHWQTVKDFFLRIWTDIKNFVADHMGLILTLILGPVGMVIAHWSQLKNFFSGLIDDIVHLFQTLPERAVSAIGNVGSRVASDIKGAFHGLHIPGFATGVTNFAGGLAVVGERGPELAYLPKGTNIYPNGTAPSSGLGGSNKPPIYITQHITYSRDSDPMANARMLAFELQRR